jgi:hypothetical protein
MLRPRPRIVAALLIIEGAVMSWQEVSWPVPYIPLAIIVIGLLVTRIGGLWRTAITVVAGVYAALFIFPGSIWALLGSCGGIMNSTCSDGEFLTGVAGYVLAAAVNVVAARLVHVLGRKSPLCAGEEPDSVT